MAIYNGIDKKISKIKNDAVQKTKDVSEMVRVTSMLKSEEEKQEGLFSDIGRVCFSKNALKDDEDLQCLYAELSESQMKIKEYKEKINILRGTITCPKCGQNVSSAQAFCSYCGEKLISEEDKKGNGEAESPISKSRFCPVCGKENTNNVKYCTGCGNSLASETEQKGAIHVKSFPQIMGTGKAAAVAKLFIAAAVTQILLAVLWFVNILEIEGFGMISTGYSVHSGFGEYSIVSYITVILCLASAGLSIYSFMQFDSSKRYRMLFQIILAVWCFLMFILLVSGALMEISTSGYDSVISLNFKFGGWLYLIDNLALLFILIRINLKTKK